jgi:serine/threonine protein kinase
MIAMTDSERHSERLPSAIKEHAKCEKCGATMRLDSGICVSCLLREGLEGGDGVSQALYQNVLAEVDVSHKPWFLGNYEILEQIGCGGMGVIYRARQRHSRRIVAVKRVLSYRADSHGALQRFRREAQAVASLDHPNILPIYEVSESEDGLPFFSMKFAEKGSLQENAPSLRNAPRKCVQLMAKVARAVEYAHSRGVLHRDIKPGNILLNDRGDPLVSDFGLAKLLDGNNDLTRSLTTFGTAGFIAPEQAGHAAVDFTPAADVYSLGAVLFKVLAGRPPFLGSNPVSVIRQASETQAPKLRSLAPSLDRDLETICAHCLERDPKARYQSAGDLADDLERWLDGRPIVARPVSPPARIWRWSRRNPKLVGTATAGVLLGAAAVSVFHTEFFRASQFNPPDKKVAVLPASDAGEIKDQGYKRSVRVSADEQPGNNVYDLYLQHLFRDVTPLTGTSSIGVRGPVQNQLNPFAVPDYTSPGSSDNARVIAVPPEKGFAARLRDRVLEPGLRTDKVTADVIAAPPGMAFNTSARDRASEAGLRTNKITADRPGSIQGFVKDAKGEPMKGTDVRIESRDGKQVFSTVKTDSKGRYISQGLQPGVYRVTLLVNGAVKASIMNTRTKANQPTQLNFDFKQTSQAGNIAKGKKNMVWVPNRTGSHIGGTWVEVDDKGNEHAESNIQTYTARRW